MSKPANELAVRELPAQLVPVTNAGVPEPIIRAALNQSDWSKAFRSGGLPAIAGALLRCHNLDLDPLANHVYVMNLGSEKDPKWSHMISAYGRLRIASRHPEFGGVVTVDEGEDDTHVWVRRVAYRIKGGMRFAAGEGEGRKPKVAYNRPDPHARRKAATQALRWALTEAFGDVLPPTTAEEVVFEDLREDPPAADALPAAPEPSGPLSSPPQGSGPEGSTPSVSLLSDQQRKHLMALAGQLQFDRATRLDDASTIVARTVDSFSTLTRDEASKVIDEWAARLADYTTADTPPPAADETGLW